MTVKPQLIAFKNGVLLKPHGKERISGGRGKRGWLNQKLRYYLGVIVTIIYK